MTVQDLLDNIHAARLENPDVVKFNVVIGSIAGALSRAHGSICISMKGKTGIRGDDVGDSVFIVTDASQEMATDFAEMVASLS